MANQDLAEAQAALRYSGAINQLERDRKRAEIQYNTNKGAIDQYGTTGKTAIEGAWAEGLGNLQGNIAQVGQDLNTQVESVGRGYRDATSVINQVQADQRARMAELASRLGATPAVSHVQTGLDNLVGQIVGNNAMDDATTTGNLKTWAAQNAALMQGGLQQAEREKAGSLSNFQTALLQALNDAQNKYADADMEFGGRLSDIHGERGAFTVDALRQLNEADWERSYREAGLQLEREKAARAIEADNASRAQAAARASKSDELDWAKFMASLSQDERDYNSFQTRDQRDAALAQAKFDWDRRQQEGEQVPYSGLEGLSRYVKDSGVSDAYASLIQGYLDRALSGVELNQALGAAEDPNFDPSMGSDPVAIAHAEWQRLNSGPQTSGSFSGYMQKQPSSQQARSMMEILANRYYG